MDFMLIIFCIPIYVTIQALTLIAISVVWVSAAIVLTLFQMPRQKHMPSARTMCCHPQTSEVAVLHMPHMQPNELFLLLSQYCQLSKPLEEENITTLYYRNNIHVHGY
jgi:hypothetical protein